MKEKIKVLKHSSICIESDKIIYIDPYDIDDVEKKAALILITHSHYDHLSPKDIEKVMTKETEFIIPKSIKESLKPVGTKENRIHMIGPNETKEILGIKVEGVRAYNKDKLFHPKENEWLGYILTIENERIYIAGDTDVTEENKKVKCDIALVPIGGTFTMDKEEAAEFINEIKPKTAIPIHYGKLVGTLDYAEIFKEKVDKDIEVIIKIKG